MDIMWYFAWILGLSFAAAFAALNAMWLELAPGQGLPDWRLKPRHGTMPQSTTIPTSGRRSCAGARY